MTHDWLYDRIFEALDGDLNTTLFEECVVDYLRHLNYIVVLIPGGRDGGRDAEIADPSGELYPAFVTTGDVRDNLRKNMPSYRKSRGNAKKYIVGSSKILPNDERIKIENLAAKKGFTELVQIYDKAAIASYLRHDSPYWRRALLGIDINLSALSDTPISRRVNSSIGLVGREPALHWLHRLQSDALMVGEPGSGKTAILSAFVTELRGKALFVVERDRNKVADAYLEMRPEIIIVDDSHEDKEFLSHLIHFRSARNHHFRIIATCWPGERQDVMRRLHIQSESVFTLPRLSSREIEHIVSEHGVRENYRLVREIERQSDRLPGRALTLADIALKNPEFTEIQSGKALFEDIIGFFHRVDDKNIMDVLACFAIGGAKGMHKSEVRNFLELRRNEMRRSIENLSGTGTIAEVPESTDCLIVRPDALRLALIREVFFNPISSSPISDLYHLIERTPEKLETARQLLQARAVGATIPESFLESFLEELPKDNAIWTEYAFSLETHAKDAVMKSMSDAIGEDFEPKPNWESELDNLLRWLKSEHESVDQALARRALCFQCAKEWLSGGNDPTVGYRVLLFTMEPRIEAFVHNDKQSSTWISGWMPEPALQRMQLMWNDIISYMKDVEPPEWDSILDIIEAWAYPIDCSYDNTYLTLTGFGQQMALDVALIAVEKIPVLHRLKTLMHRGYPDLNIISDPVVNTLYPVYEFADDRDVQQRNAQSEVAQLAESWNDRVPSDVVKELARFENGLLGARGIHFRFTPYLCHLLAEHSAVPLKWFECFLESNLPADTVVPFLHVAIEKHAEGWEKALQGCFESERTKEQAVCIILTQNCIPETLRQAAVRDAAMYPDTVAHLVWSNRVTQTSVLDLYSHEDNSLVGKVAIAQWQQQKTREIPNWIRLQWEEAIIENAEEDHWLDTIFSVQPDLGKRWLEHKVRDSDFEPYKFELSISTVVASMEIEERVSLLKIIPDKYKMHSVVEVLVGDDAELFERLMKLQLDDYIKLSPLGRGSIDSVWIEFAEIAHDYGYDAQSIASLAFTGVVFTGEYVDRVKHQCEQFDAIQTHTRASVRKIALAGYEMNYSHYQQLLKREREDDSDNWD